MKWETRIERLIDELGFELVALERGGGRRRPLIRVRIDRPDAVPGQSSVTVDDCARVSRAVDELLEGESETESYILEVSSPGIERPLVRPSDYDRFAGQEVRVRGFEPLVGRSREVVGRLIGRVGEAKDEIALDLEGARLEVPLGAVAKAQLVFSWEDARPMRPRAARSAKQGAGSATPRPPNERATNRDE